METVTITINDLSLFRACQEEERLDWWATFSVEPSGDVYPFVTRGLTPLDKRIYLRSEFPKLAEIADAYLGERPSGGRFLSTDEAHIFMKPNVVRLISLLSFRSSMMLYMFLLLQEVRTLTSEI
jgi:hypothetical protein